MIQRMIGAARLKADVYEEVEADKSATGQAMAVVVLAALATGIAFLGVGGTDVVGVVLGVVLALLGWALLAWITYMVGTRLFPTPDTSADWGELARTLGFAQSPGILRIFGIVPGIGPFIFSIASIWLLVTTVIAIRQALDYTSTWRAVGVAIVSYIPQSLLLGAAASLFV
ncbi:MAG: hypothetical protein O6920_05135 [Chloroflexi bacterium]|nr:hypothetical protein [Chloroflexota bacterium]